MDPVFIVEGEDESVMIADASNKVPVDAEFERIGEMQEKKRKELEAVRKKIEAVIVLLLHFFKSCHMFVRAGNSLAPINM